jgi:Flp pilus assembly protein TadG
MNIRSAKRNQKGSALIEFTLVGIPLILILISVLEISIAMWDYHMVAYAVREGARYASTKGQGCTYSGNTCGITVANVAHQIASAGVGLVPGQLNVTLTSSAGTVTCNPLSNCYSNTATWPPNSGTANWPGSIISITGTYPVQTALVFTYFIPTGLLQLSSVTLPASSQQLIQF